MRHIIMSHLFLSWCYPFLKFLSSRIWSIRYIEKCYHLLFRRLFLMNNQYINETYKVLFIKNGLFHFPAKCWIQCVRHTIRKRRQNSLSFSFYIKSLNRTPLSELCIVASFVSAYISVVRMLVWPSIYWTVFKGIL